MWDAWELAAKLDQLAQDELAQDEQSQNTLVTSVFKRTAESPTYPNYPSLFAQLNIQVKDGELSFMPSKLRRQLVTPAKQTAESPPVKQRQAE